MKLTLSDFSIIAKEAAERKAAELFSEEIKHRTGQTVPVSGEAADRFFIKLVIEDESKAENFSINVTADGITVTAHRLRSLIYGFFFILRKCEIKNGRLILIKDVTGDYSPAMALRGHNLSFTEGNNTCDAWNKAQYRTYILELMAFGLNTAEDSYCVKNVKTDLMPMEPREALEAISEICVELDLDVMLFYPLDKKFSDEETAQKVVDELKDLPRLNYLFLPGGDPGNLQAKPFAERCKKIYSSLSKIYPDIKLFPSAQAPHEFPDWGKNFKEAVADKPDEFSWVVFGPNHAMPLDELRRSVPLKYPLMQYADITHNVRCETPVHFTRDDWHYTWAATLSREAVNPRPREYKLLHQRTRQYLDGNVPYSEGVSDDVNKIVWSALDFDFESSLYETLCDYARFYMPEVPCEKCAELIFGLEQNWEAAPEESFSVEAVFDGFDSILKNTPVLYENWRFLLLYFRALCDKLVRDRRIFELGLIDEAAFEIRNGNLPKAEEILASEFSSEYKKHRETLFVLGKKLYELIGIQLDVEHFHGKSAERGCTLETIDLPVTDRVYLLNKLKETHNREYMIKLLDRNRVAKDEYYFSVAEHGLNVSGMQTGEFYLDFNGDKNTEALRPMCITDGFDHFNFSFKAAGLTGGDYILKITYMKFASTEGSHFMLKINSHIIYEGKLFGGRRDEEYEKLYLPDGFCCVDYDIPKEYLENGCALLEMSEPTTGFVMYEFRFLKK